MNESATPEFWNCRAFFDPWFLFDKHQVGNVYLWAREKAHLVQLLALQSWGPEFDSQNPQKKPQQGMVTKYLQPQG